MTTEVIEADAKGFKYDADAYVKYWKEAQSKVKRYFDSDNPLQSVTNFTNDLIKGGKATKVGDDITWQFESSAEAAKALGLSVQATET